MKRIILLFIMILISFFITACSMEIDGDIDANSSKQTNIETSKNEITELTGKEAQEVIEVVEEILK